MTGHHLASTASAIVLSLMLNQAAAAQDTAFAELKDAEDKIVGTVRLTDTPNGVLLRLDLTDAEPGERAFHIHETGECEPPDFTSAGGHFNPDGAHHGHRSDEGPHAGDMPNLHIPDNGQLTVEVLNMLVTLDKDDTHSLLQKGGTALVIHEGPDDYETDPTGEAGGRYACGVIE